MSLEIREETDLRRMIRNSWERRRGGFSFRGTGEEGSPVPPGVRQRLFQRLLSDLETTTGMLDRSRIRRVIAESPDAAALSEEAVERLEQEIADEASGLGPVAPLLRDATVSDVLINGPYEVWVDRFGKLEKTTARFDDDAHLRRLLRRAVASQGRRLDDASPHVDVRLPDGSRLNAVLPPVSLRGAVVSIRRMRETPFKIEELIAFGTLTPEMADFLTGEVRRRRNVVIAGGAGAGKTTLLNVLSQAIPPDERVVTIEETAELRLEHPHVVSLEARLPNVEGQGEVTVRTLVKNALRMRADRIIVGEVRGSEAFEMIQAMHIGHDGSLTTVHASSPRDALRRLQSLVLMGGGDLPARTVNELLGSAVHLVVQLRRFADGSRRVTSISAVDLADSEIVVRELHRWRVEEAKFESGGGSQPLPTPFLTFDEEVSS